jgi:hypothetical protein
LVWNTILAQGKVRDKDCIFVTAEEKPDWWVRNYGAFQPRVELIEEYRTYTGGRTIHIVVLSRLLEIFEVGEETIVNVRRAEQANTAAVVLGSQPDEGPVRSNEFWRRRYNFERRSLRRLDRDIAVLQEADSSPEQQDRIRILERQRRWLISRIVLMEEKKLMEEGAVPEEPGE